MAKPRTPYRLIKVEGRGGYAEVWRAEARSTGEEVAFKRPLAKVLARARIRREIEMLNTFVGPHVMPVVDADPDSRWYAMPLAQGTLANLWSDGKLGSNAEQVAVDLLTAIRDGLHLAHDQGVVHRDISPSNVLALADSKYPGGLRWVVADWGLARRPPGMTITPLTGSGQGLGLYGYAAPETWNDAHKVDIRADVYSVGRVLAWLLTGQRPAGHALLLPSGKLRAVVADATAYRREDRPPSLDVLLALAKAHIVDIPLSPRQQVRSLVADPDLSMAELRELRRLARNNADDPTLYLYELSRLSVLALNQWVHDRPSEAAEAATTMCRHVLNLDFVSDVKLLARPLGWIFAVLQALLDANAMDLAEDVAIPFFRAEAKVGGQPHLVVTDRWFRNLGQSHGLVVARAIRRAGAAGYYRRHLGMEAVFNSPELEAELGY